MGRVRDQIRTESVVLAFARDSIFCPHPVSGLVVTGVVTKEMTYLRDRNEHGRVFRAKC